MTPTLANGKICYLEIPAIDIRRSIEFYKKVFGWRIRQRSDGSIAFERSNGPSKWHLGLWSAAGWWPTGFARLYHGR
jgi:hypothetical protein